MSAWLMTFIWMALFTCILIGQLVIWGIRLFLPGSVDERMYQRSLLHGTALLLMVFLLIDAAMLLASLHGFISLAGLL